MSTGSASLLALLPLLFAPATPADPAPSAEGLSVYLVATHAEVEAALLDLTPREGIALLGSTRYREAMRLLEETRTPRVVGPNGEQLRTRLELLIPSSSPLRPVHAIPREQWGAEYEAWFRAQE